MVIITIIALALALAVIFALRAVLSYRLLSADGAEEYVYRQSENMLCSTISQADFVSAYRRVNAPRGALYAAILFFCNAALTVPLLSFLTFAFEYLWRYSGQSRVIEPGYMVWSMMLCAGVILGWGLMSYLIMSRYHARTPGTLEQELRLLSGI